MAIRVHPIPKYGPSGGNGEPPDSGTGGPDLAEHIADTTTHGVATGAIVGTTMNQTLTNKIIDGLLNQLRNISDGSIHELAAIQATKIANGTVSNAEFQALDGVTGPLQPQLDTKVTGPATATDHALARFDGLTGTLIQDSTALLADSGDLQLAAGLKVGPTTVTEAGMIQYDGTDLVGWVEGKWLSLTKAETVTEGVWRWSTGTVPPPPLRSVMVNQADYALATLLWITRISNANLDRTPTLDYLKAGDEILLLDPNDASLNARYTIEPGTITQYTDYYEFPVSLVEASGGTFMNNSELRVVFLITTGGVAEADIGPGEANTLTYWTGINTVSFDPELHYDPTTQRLGIGTSTPRENLELVGALILGNAVTTTNGTIRFDGIDLTGRVGDAWVSLTRQGDIVGPAGTTDNALARFDGATGKLLQDSVILVTDAGAVSGITTLTTSGLINGATPTEISYLSGATSNLQAQINTLTGGSTPGDVIGPASSTDMALARFDGTTGKLIQNSPVFVSDSGGVTGIATLTASGAINTTGTINGVTPTELGYVTGATSNIQAQIDSMTMAVDGGIF